MAVPAPVLTVIPNTATLTENALTPSVQLTDTATHAPAATSRAFRAAGVSVVPTVGDAAGAKSVAWPVVGLAGGATAMSVNTVNADGNATSATVNLTVTDAVATQAPVLTKYGISRMAPDKLPAAFRDPTKATPGLPTAVVLRRANLTGTVAAP